MASTSPHPRPQFINAPHGIWDRKVDKEVLKKWKSFDLRPPLGQGSPLLQDSQSSDDELPLDLGPEKRKKPRHPPKPASTDEGVDLSHRSVLLFPGQGSQFVGMGKKLLGVPSVRELYAEASQILGYDLLALSLEGPQHLLDRTQYCQAATVVSSLAAVELLYQVVY